MMIEESKNQSNNIIIDYNRVGTGDSSIATVTLPNQTNNSNQIN